MSDTSDDDVDDIYDEYSIRSEHSLFVDFKEKNNKRCNACENRSSYCSFSDIDDEITSNLVIEYNTWEFTYSPRDKALQLEMFMHESDKSKTMGEVIIWCWKGMEIAIVKKTLHEFCAGSSKIIVPTAGFAPANKKFNVVIRLLDERIDCDANSLESYYGDYGDIEKMGCKSIFGELHKCRRRKCRSTIGKVTLSIAGTEESSFIVPKHDLLRASPVFQRMFTHDMTEKATNKVDIPDTNPEDFGDFLKAISPKQEHPNPSNVLALLKLAHIYECQTLLERCEKHLVNCVELPLMELLHCVDLYGLNKLKKNLLMSIEKTELSKLVQQSKPHFGMLSLLIKMDDELMKETN